MTLASSSSSRRLSGKPISIYYRQQAKNKEIDFFKETPNWLQKGVARMLGYFLTAMVVVFALFTGRED